MSERPRPLVLVVEDEPAVAQVVSHHLQLAGFDVQPLARGDAAEAVVRALSPAAVVLDVMLPGINGFEVCRQLRRFSTVPVLMLSSRASEADRLEGFDAGVDDYLCKPFNPQELVARMKALLRRGQPVAASTDPQLLQVDTLRQRIRCGGQTLDLTPQEYRLLSVMAQHPARVFSRVQLLELAYDDATGVFDRAVDSHIKNIRKKLQAVLPAHGFIQSVYGQGYRFEVLVNDPAPAADAPPPEPDVARVPVDMKPWLPGFIATRLQALEEMDAALEQQDVAAALRMAHRLAGSFALYGFTEAARACHRLEHEGPSLGTEVLRQRTQQLLRHVRQIQVRFVDDQGNEVS